MKIISPFNDFYDSIQYMYGGGDPNNVYVRKNSFDISKDTKEELRLLLDSYANYLNSFDVSINYSHATRGYTYELLNVAGNLFIIHKVGYTDNDKEKYITFYEVATKEYIYTKSADSVRDRMRNLRIVEYIEDSLEQKIDKLFDTLEGLKPLFNDIARLISQPVFIINLDDLFRRYTSIFYIVNTDIPILNDIKGLTKEIDPLKAYTDIESYLLNVVKENPDRQPPVEVGEKDKIQQHGFDLKKSFRHRK